MPTRTPLRGEIWYIKLPTDPPGKGGRPVVIVSVDARNRHERATTVMVISHHLHSQRKSHACLFRSGRDWLAGTIRRAGRECNRCPKRQFARATRPHAAGKQYSHLRNGRQNTVSHGLPITWPGLCKTACPCRIKWQRCRPLPNSFRSNSAHRSECPSQTGCGRRLRSAITSTTLRSSPADSVCTPSASRRNVPTSASAGITRLPRSCCWAISAPAAVDSVRCLRVGPKPSTGTNPAASPKRSPRSALSMPSSPA